MFRQMLLWVLLCTVLGFDFTHGCPDKICDCGKPNKAQKVQASCDGRGLKKIMAPDSLTNVSVLDLSNNKLSTIPTRAFGVQKSLKKLYLSRNKITTLKQGAFLGLSRLNRLYISYNDLLNLNGEPFKGLRSLKILDLSNNNLNFINGTVFQGLKKLQTLILSYNKFVIIPEATLKPLPALKSLNLESNDLVCDCHIKWLLRKKKLRKKGLEGTCQYPEPSKNKKLSRVSPKNLQCAKLTLPHYDFQPNNNEVAIEGDSFTYTCETTWIPILTINWYKNNQLLKPPKPNTQLQWNITFKVDFQTDRLTSILRLAKVSFDDRGTYRCTVSSDMASITGQSTLNVLPGGSMFCRSEITKTPKGVFQWDNTGLGIVARHACPAGVLRGPRTNYKGVAYRTCGRDGKWQNVEGSECAYVDVVTQRLYNLKQLPVNASTVLPISRALYTLTENATVIKSDVDVSIVANFLESLKPLIAGNFKVGQVIVSIISNMMDVDENILATAQMRTKACSSFVIVLDVLANSNGVGTKFISGNVGMTIIPVFPATFQGITCAARQNNDGRLKSVLCKLPWKDPTVFYPPKFETSIHLPKAVLAGQDQASKQLNLKFMVYRNSKLFPHLYNGTLVTNPRVYTSVVSIKIGQSPFRNLTEPIAIKYRNQKISDKYPPIPIYWDQSMKRGIGAWMENTGCTVNKDANTTITYCTKLDDKNHFAVLTQIETPVAAPANSDARRRQEVVVYIGAALCVLLLLITFVTYAVFRKLRYNRDDAAMIMNLCLALIVTVLLFAIGIYHVTNTLMCRAVGVLLHYFVLCSLLWVGCGALCLCRLLRTAVTPEEFNPVLRYYMISWGIPLIVCGITVAGNPENYSVQNYCWLGPHPFLGAVVGPACLVILIDIILYIRLNNLIYTTYSMVELNTCTAPLEEEQAALATADENNEQSGPILSKSELLQHLNEVLPDKSDILLYQKASLITLLLIVINFVLAMFLVKYNASRSLYMVLSCGYAIGNVVLGAVIFVFHCLKKQKAKKYWKECFSSCFHKRNYLVDHEVVPNTDSTSDKPSTLLNGDTPRDNGAPSNANSIPRIYGAPLEPIASDIQSNVSLPSSAALTINDREIAANNVDNGGEAVSNPHPAKPSSPPGSDKHSLTTSMSDKQSWVSAPLPFSHVKENIKDNQPPRYSYCFADSSSKKKKKKPRNRAPLALPDRNGISSSRESSLKPPKEPPPMQRPSENHQIIHEKEPIESAPSELSSAREPISYLETPVPYSSCASSDVSVPVPVTMTARPPIPRASDIRTLGPVSTGAPSGDGHHPVHQNHYPRPLFIPPTFGDPGMRFRNPNYAAYPAEERYVSMPRRTNGYIGHRQSESDHVYESIDEQNEDDCKVNGAVKHSTPVKEQNGSPRPENDIITDSENTSLLGPPQGVNGNGPNDNLPRRRPRERRSSDKSRTRRYRDSAGRRRETSSRSRPTRSSASLKSDRIKPEPKEWVADPVPKLTYVPVPHLLEKNETRAETSV